MIFALGIYLDYIKNKGKFITWVLYIIPCFIHISSFILLALKIISSMKNKKIIIGILCLIAIIMIFPNIITIIIPRISNNILDNITEKILLYFGTEELNVSLQFCFRVFQSIFIILLGIYGDYINKGKNRITAKHNQYLYTICLFLILSIPYYTVFFRINDFLLVVMLPKILDSLSAIKNKRDKYMCYSVCILFIIAGIRIQIPIFNNMF